MSMLQTLLVNTPQTHLCVSSEAQRLKLFKVVERRMALKLQQTAFFCQWTEIAFQHISAVFSLYKTPVRGVFHQSQAEGDRKTH